MVSGIPRLVGRDFYPDCGKILLLYCDMFLLDSSRGRGVKMRKVKKKYWCCRIILLSFSLEGGRTVMRTPSGRVREEV